MRWGSKSSNGSTSIPYFFCYLLDFNIFKGTDAGEISNAEADRVEWGTSSAVSRFSHHVLCWKLIVMIYLVTPSYGFPSLSDFIMIRLRLLNSCRSNSELESANFGHGKKLDVDRFDGNRKAFHIETFLFVIWIIKARNHAAERESLLLNWVKHKKRA